jgi:hypothetical protein
MRFAEPRRLAQEEKAAPEEAKAKKQAARTQRAASKAVLRTRWLKRREALEVRKQWQGSRTFDAWLLEQGEFALNKMDEAEAAEMPQVCHRCAVFADLLGVQKWQWYVFTMEKLAWVYAKDQKALQASLDGLKQDFQLSTTSE